MHCAVHRRLLAKLFVTLADALFVTLADALFVTLADALLFQIEVARDGNVTTTLFELPDGLSEIARDHDFIRRMQVEFDKVPREGFCCGVLC